MGSNPLPYAIWVGIGVFGTVILGVYFFSEPISLMRGVFFILLIIALIGLKMTT